MKKQIKKVISNIETIIIAALMIWFIASMLNIIHHNLNIDTSSVANWNMFEIIFGR